ncbi:unnamed protein product [Closterium sp. NIES-65]|nr:unnamed protein product [Closterium sp. NIES-65]
MLDVAMHVVGEGDACPTHSFNAPSVSLIGNSPEGLSLWVASTSTPLVNAMEPLCKGIHRLLVRCPIAPADTTPPHVPSSAAPPTAMTLGHTTPEAPAEGAAEKAEATAGAASGEAGTTAEAADAARPATGAESEASTLSSESLLPLLSDLRGMDADALPHLTSIKVRDFLAHMASLTPEGRCPSITCRMAAPLAEVMALASLVLPCRTCFAHLPLSSFFATASMPFREAFAFATIPLFDSAGGTTGFGSSSTGAGTPGVLGGAAAQGPAHQGCWAGQQGEGQGRAQGALGRRGLAAGRWRKGGLRPGMSLGGPLLVDIPCLQRVKECYTEDQLFVRIHVGAWLSDQPRTPCVGYWGGG